MEVEENPEPQLEMEIELEERIQEGERTVEYDDVKEVGGQWNEVKRHI